MLTIIVTQAHIDAGGHSCGDCPLALALQAAGAADCSVGFSHAFHGPPSDRVLFPLPPRAAKFRQDYDDELPVKPFSFEMEIPSC